MIQPETQFATVGNDRVAYQVVGEGPRDLVYTTGFSSHLDIEWEDPGMARFFRRLASFSRLIRYDRRGAGLSDRPSDAGSSEVEHWLQDYAACSTPSARRRRPPAALSARWSYLRVPENDLAQAERSGLSHP